MADVLRCWHCQAECTRSFDMIRVHGRNWAVCKGSGAEGACRPALTQVPCCPEIRVTAEAQAVHEDRQATEPDHDTSKAACCCFDCWDFRHTPGQVSVPGNELPEMSP